LSRGDLETPFLGKKKSFLGQRPIGERQAKEEEDDQLTRQLLEESNKKEDPSSNSKQKPGFAPIIEEVPATTMRKSVEQDLKLSPAKKKKSEPKISVVDPDPYNVLPQTSFGEVKNLTLGMNPLRPPDVMAPGS